MSRHLIKIVLTRLLTTDFCSQRFIPFQRDVWQLHAQYVADGSHEYRLKLRHGQRRSAAPEAKCRFLHPLPCVPRDVLLKFPVITSQRIGSHSRVGIVVVEAKCCEAAGFGCYMSVRWRYAPTPRLPLVESARLIVPVPCY